MATKGYTWNVSRWMERLGFNRQELPEFAFGVQPVVILGDHSQLVSPLLAARTIVGGQRTSAALNSVAFTIQSNAPGGTFIEEVKIASGSIETWTWEFNETPIPLTNVVTLDIQNMTDDEHNIVARVGDTTVAPGSDVPITQERAVSLTGIYIRPGREFMVRSANFNVLGRFAAVTRDVPAIIPS